MAGLYTVISRAPGTLITALIYNSDHQAHVDGRTATLMQSYAATLAQVNITENPFPGAVESLAASFAGELARLRFDISALKSSLTGGLAVNWYDPVTSPGFASIGAQVHRNSNFSVPHDTLTAINFSTTPTVHFNSNNTWVSGNPTRFTAPFTGKYYVSCSVRWDNSDANGRRELRIRTNGTTSQTVISHHETNVVNFIYQTVSGILALTATDYVEFMAYQNSGSAVNLTLTSSDYRTIGGIVFLGS